MRWFPKLLLDFVRELLLFAALVVGLVVGVPALWADSPTVTYRFEGVGLSGTLNGAQFSEASWSVEVETTPALATVESVEVLGGEFVSLIRAPLAGSPVLRLGGQIEVTVSLDALNGYEWQLVEIDYGSQLGAGAVVYSLGSLDPLNPLERAVQVTGFAVFAQEGPGFGQLRSIGATFAVSGELAMATSAFNTSGGSLLFLEHADGESALMAQFSAVPEPAAAAGVAGLGALALGLVARRRTRANGPRGG